MFVKASDVKWGAEENMQLMKTYSCVTKCNNDVLSS
jgi:hypothetical protein